MRWIEKKGQEMKWLPLQWRPVLGLIILYSFPLFLYFFSSFSLIHSLLFSFLLFSFSLFPLFFLFVSFSPIIHFCSLRLFSTLFWSTEFCSFCCFHKRKIQLKRERERERERKKKDKQKWKIKREEEEEEVKGKREIVVFTVHKRSSNWKNYE